jgi:uncharacterized protein (TIGR02246 family)
MAGQQAEEAEVRQLIERLIEAIQAMDLEAMKQIYAPDIVTFDVTGPLQGVGARAKEGNWEEAFAMFQRPLGYEIRDLSVTTGGDVAFAHGLGRLSGTLENGSPAGGFWVRFTGCFRKIDGSWRIAHDHASVPLDMGSGRASLNLEP